MNRSESITKISAALVKAQSQMSNATKGASNPYFKSKYSDLNSIREVSLPVLNAQGITVLQPTTMVDGKPFVETTLLHESGEFLSSLTEIIVAKQHDAQSHGSGVSYARRYGLQAFLCIGAEDDDGEKAVGRKDDSTTSVAKGNAAKDDTKASQSQAATAAPKTGAKAWTPNTKAKSVTTEITTETAPKASGTGW